jgi:hypothetical protein
MAERCEPHRHCLVQGIGVDRLRGAADRGVTGHQQVQPKPDPYPTRRSWTRSAIRRCGFAPLQHRADPDGQDRGNPCRTPRAARRSWTSVNVASRSADI